MPLYIVKGNDHRQISTDDLADMMKIPKDIVEKIKKNPVFEINEKLVKPDKLNGGFIAPAGRQSKPRFHVMVDKKTNTITDSMDGIRTEIRYALSIVPDKENERLSTYEPRRVRFEDMMDIVPNYELALFKFCMPDCKESPIVSKRNWYYTFQNKEAKAISITDHGQKIGKAMAYINNGEANGGLTDTQIILSAKGLYAMNREANYIPNPSARNKTIIEIKADLVNFALKNVDLFLTTIDDDVNEFYGMILDAVDRGIFGIRSTTHSKSWYWESGPNKNTQIVEISPTLNEFDTLKSAVEANPNAFYSAITRAVSEATGRDSIKEFIAKKKRAQAEEDTKSQAVPDKPIAVIKSDEVKKHETIYQEPEPEDDDEKEEIFQHGEDYLDQKEGPELVNNEQDDEMFEEMMTEKQIASDPTFIIPDKYNDAVKLATTFNDGKIPHTTVLSKFWKEVKAGKVTAENIKPLIAKLIEENI